MHLFMFSGVPGSGKTTLAKAIARHYKIPYFGKDEIQQFLFQRGLITENTIDGYLWMLTQAQIQLDLGISCVVEAVFPQQGFRNKAQQIAETFGAQFVPVYCYCSDETLWKTRWHQRAETDSSSHWMEFTWADVERVAANFEPWVQQDVIQVDAMDCIENNLEKLISIATTP